MNIELQFENPIKEEFSGQERAVDCSISTYINMQKSRYLQLAEYLNREQSIYTESIEEFKNSKDDRYCRIIVRINDNIQSLEFYTLLCEDPSGSIRIKLKKEDLAVLLENNIKLAMQGTIIGLNYRVSNREKVLSSISFPGDSMLLSESDWADSETESEIAIMSDIHVGSRFFKESEFKAALDYIRNKPAIKYLIIAGDSIDGTGVYPAQNHELKADQQSCSSQYKSLADLLSILSPDLRIILTPGNHDGTVRASPQPPIPVEFSKFFTSNVEFRSNPSELFIENRRILIYHGQSLDQIIAKNEGLTFDKPQLVMEFLLKIRHMSPTIGRNSSTLWGLDDPLIIKNKPWLFITGHIHTMTNFRLHCGTLLVNSGAWQGLTPFQARLGIVAEICKLTVVPLTDNSRSYTINFLRE
jgi:DNA polymerase II small subunit